MKSDQFQSLTSSSSSAKTFESKKVPRLTVLGAVGIAKQNKADVSHSFSDGTITSLKNRRNPFENAL